MLNVAAAGNGRGKRMDIFLTAGEGKRALYGKNIVRILDVSGSGCHVVKENEPDHKFFWVPAAKLLPAPPVSPVKEKKANPVVKPAQEIVAKEVEPQSADAFVEWLRKTGNSLIVASMPEKFYEKFQQKYESVSGGALLRRANDGISVTPNGRARWYSMRVYFVGPPASIPVPSNAIPNKAQHQGKAYTHQINSNAFVLELIAQGFELGRPRQ